MALPKEPRQKMINIMYLVLTALLALNVSSEILNAFKTVNRSLQNSNEQVNLSTGTILKSLEDKANDPQTKDRATPWLQKAKQVESTTKTLYDRLQALKNKILTLAGGKPGDETVSFKEDNLDIVTKLMVKEGEGKKLLAELTQYQKSILAIDPAIDSTFKSSPFVDVANPPGRDGKIKDWEVAYFNMVPTVAGITILSKFQNDIKTAENKVVALCHTKVGEVKIIFDSYSPIVGQSSGYLFPGQELEITAGIGAYNKSSAPQITIGGSSVPLGAEGFASYKTNVSEHSVPVRISYFDQFTGKNEVKEVAVKYTIGSPSGATVGLPEMNVLYVGWKNEVRVASNAGDEKTQVSISGGGGSLQKTGAGSYIASVTTPTNDCRINVTVDGKVSSFPFRVRQIPDPIATVGGVASNENVPAGQFRNQPGVSAYIKDFPLDIKYSVTSFTITMDDANGDIQEAAVQGNTWNAQALAIVRGAVAGRMVTIDNIYAVGPDGKRRKVPGLVYYIR
jgi:gliding motility-associated protein GldM